MRQLELDDVFRFSYMLEQTGLTGVVQDIFRSASEVRCNRQPKIDEEEIGSKILQMTISEKTVKDIGAEVISLCAEKDRSDVELYALGIESIVKIFRVAAKKGVSAAVYSFLAPIWEMKEDDIAHMKLVDVRGKLREMLEVNDVKSFFDLFRLLID